MLKRNELGQCKKLIIIIIIIIIIVIIKIIIIKMNKLIVKGRITWYNVKLCLPKHDR